MQPGGGTTMGYIEELRSLIGARPLIMVGAGVFILDDHRRLLMIHRIDNNTWSIPGGSMEPGESLEDTARREVHEETGLEIDSLGLMGVYSGMDYHYVYPNGDEVYNVTAAYVSGNPTGQLTAGDSETNEIKWFRLEEIPANISPPVKPILADFIEEFMERD